MLFRQYPYYKEIVITITYNDVLLIIHNKIKCVSIFFINHIVFKSHRIQIQICGLRKKAAKAPQAAPKSMDIRAFFENSRSVKSDKRQATVIEID